MSTTGNNVKESLEAFIQLLPDDVTWDEVQYRIYARQQIEEGLADSEAGRVITSEEMERLLEAQIQRLKGK